MSLTLIAIFLALSVFGVPLAVSLGIAVLGTLILFDFPLSILSQRMFSSMNNFLLVAVPLFILAGGVAERAGVAERIFNAASAVVGRWRGGLGHVNILGSQLFGAISGSSVADVTSLGQLQIAAMTARGYPRPYAAGLTLITAIFSSIMPPSILMIIAATTAGQSVGAALAGGIGPALVIGASFMLANYLISARYGYGKTDRVPFRQALITIIRAIPALGAPVIILGGIFGGFVTPTEAAGLAVIYLGLVGALLFRQLRWREVPTILIRTGIMTGTVLFVAMTAAAATFIFAVDGLPARVGSLLLTISTDPLVILLLIGAVLLIVGMFMDIIAAIFILIPVLMPTVIGVGIDPIHFVVFFVFALSIGLTTPPVGVCLFAASLVAQLRIETVAKATLPFYATAILMLIIIAMFPAIVLWPAQLLVGR
ncbi:MAG: TRAP transporter large permease [Truepera sp.]|nr:TRAP transporter large permease [Truepera sp.]